MELFNAPWLLLSQSAEPLGLAGSAGVASFSLLSVSSSTFHLLHPLQELSDFRRHRFLPWSCYAHCSPLLPLWAPLPLQAVYASPSCESDLSTTDTCFPWDCAPFCPSLFITEWWWVRRGSSFPVPPSLVSPCKCVQPFPIMTQHDHVWNSHLRIAQWSCKKCRTIS